MSTNPKTSRQKQVKKAKCKMASPISNDRAEAFVGPQAEVCPRSSDAPRLRFGLVAEAPSERDARAFDLQAQGMTRRQIAQELHTSQPTVQRGIEKYRRWFGTTLPEDRGEMTGFSRFRVALEEHRIFLRHQRELAMEEWELSRQPVPVKRVRTKVYPEGRKSGGAPITETQTDVYLQRRNASASHLNAAARRSLELTMLEAGYLGVRRLSCDQAIDPDERERWDRAVKSRDTTIEELTRKVAELEAKLAGKNSTLDESRTAKTTPVVNQTSPGPEVASPIQKVPSGDRPESSRPVSQGLNQVNQERELGEGLPAPPTGLTEGLPKAGRGDLRSGVSAGPATRAEQGYISSGSETRAEPTPAEPEEKRPRWSEKHRREALDYHCKIHGLPWADLNQATGIPDHARIAPKLCIERGYPYLIYIDWSIKPENEPTTTSGR